jgi:hypothetical protein
MECSVGPVTQSLSICKHQFNVDKNTESVPIQICKSYLNSSNQYSVDRRV